jgi:hypothetical protein
MRYTSAPLRSSFHGKHFQLHKKSQSKLSPFRIKDSDQVAKDHIQRQITTGQGQNLSCCYIHSRMGYFSGATDQTNNPLAYFDEC